MPERIYHTVMRTMFKAANGDNKRNTVDRIGSEIVRLHLQVAHGQTGITHKLDKLAHILTIFKLDVDVNDTRMLPCKVVHVLHERQHNENQDAACNGNFVKTDANSQTDAGCCPQAGSSCDASNLIASSFHNRASTNKADARKDLRTHTNRIARVHTLGDILIRHHHNG